MFIFVRCLRSSAAVTPVKYERDIVQVTGVFATLKNCENNGTEEISLVTPTPGHENPHMRNFQVRRTLYDIILWRARGCRYQGTSLTGVANFSSS